MEQRDVEFKSIVLKLASTEDILAWSHGEVTKPETINYRTQRAEKDGLFDERIFGPTKDWECYCGKYKRIRYKGIVCDKCGVEVTRSIVRRERMGHIKLASPVSHIWFLRGVPSKMGLILDLSVSDLEKVIYFAGYIIVKVDEEARARSERELEREFKEKKRVIKDEVKLDELKGLRDKARDELKSLQKHYVLSENDYRRLSLKYGEVFEAGIGAEALRKIMEFIRLEGLERELRDTTVKVTSPLLKRKHLRRLKLVRGMIRSGVRPESMFLEVIPVIPPELRPMVSLDGGRYATSDLNDLYRRVINRNNRLKRLYELNAPEVIVRNEKRMLQEAVDALIDNSARRGGQQAQATTLQRRPLRSLADMLRGKQGRFRQNLLGKRVDYSGRSVIVVGPELKLHQCGLPKKMALELFKPFVIHKLIEREIAHNIRGANRLIEDEVEEVWAILEEVIQDKFVLLNRAPTLHRLGIQAFKPLLIEGEAIQLHPLVCNAFNADFDGDQMAVHVPLTEEAQKEAAEIMLSTRNMLKPATGSPIVDPTQDIVLGSYWMTFEKPGAVGEGTLFSGVGEAVLVYEFGHVDLHAKVKVRMPRYKVEGKLASDKKPKEDLVYVETTVGRVLFNQSLPEDFRYVNEVLPKKVLSSLTDEIMTRYGEEKAAEVFDRMKSQGFSFATKSGVSWGMDDLVVPEMKFQLVKEAELEVQKIQEEYEKGLLTESERYDLVIGVWAAVEAKVKQAVPKTLDPFGSIYTIIASGSRGSWAQPGQMSGMKGQVVNPVGKLIELPIISSFKEGLSPLEYFISTHGARKGTTDTALKTAEAGYLTRRLVDVSQDLVINEEDCGDKQGFPYNLVHDELLRFPYGVNVYGRFLAQDVKDEKGKLLVRADTLLDREKAKIVNASNAPTIWLRSPISCRSWNGLCQKCYSHDLGKNRLVELGQAVGIVAAQSIGEPGTQLTMRTFHTGGVASASDITRGLPRVGELFEVRPPRGRATISDVFGEVKAIKDEKGEKKILVKTFPTPSSVKSRKFKRKTVVNPTDEREFVIPHGTALTVKVGDKIDPGTPLTEGNTDLRELFKVAGSLAVQQYIVQEVVRTYAFHGASIDAKHIEVMARQMFSRVKIKDPGSTHFTSGEVVEKSVFRQENERIKQASGKPARALQLLYGITRAALSTESFLSAASFQETARVLIQAAIEGKEDSLKGLKENVIIGRLIPVGTGFGKTTAS